MENELKQHFSRLSDDQLEFERKSGKLVPTAQLLADEEYIIRQSAPKTVDPDQLKIKTKRKISWIEWILIAIAIRAVFKLIGGI